jgi:hypothetical protein
MTPPHTIILWPVHTTPAPMRPAIGAPGKGCHVAGGPSDCVAGGDVVGVVLDGEAEGELELLHATSTRSALATAAGIHVRRTM